MIIHSIAVLIGKLFGSVMERLIDVKLLSPFHSRSSLSTPSVVDIKQ